MRGEKRIINAQMALHEKEFKKAVKQRKYMKQHSESVLELLDILIERTRAAAPKRCKDYCLSRPPGLDKVKDDSERHLEQAIFKRWNRKVVQATVRPFQGALCHHIQTFQMPLKEHRDDKAWGMIDLVGVSGLGLPVVIELKTAEATDNPLSMLVQGLAYAVALQEAWNEGDLCRRWMSCQSQEFDAPVRLERVPVVGIAPIAYWKRKLGQVGKSPAGKVPETAWEPFRSLCKACSDWGFPIEFLEFEVRGSDSEGLPIVGDPVPVRGIETA